MPKIIIKPLIAPSEDPDENDGAIDEDDDGDDAFDDQIEDEPIMKRARGRPRGAGRTRATAGTPRGRGRGRGRPRGRGAGSITIRLPRRTEDDEEEGDETEQEVADDVAEDAEPSKEKERGRPSRKVLGQVYFIEGDEFVTEDDPKGDTKIDEWGNLLGGRRFKASTFILPNRHDKRRYMLAIDAARTSGFRDSLYYFRRNPLAFKLNATQSEKDFLISDGKLGPHLRTRSVTLITARSAYKLHGSKTIVDGKWVTDDYYEDKVLEEITERGLKPGDPVGELPDPHAQSAANDSLASVANLRNERANAASGAGVGMYRAGGPTTIFGPSGWGPYSDGPLNAVRKSILTRDGVTEENWMWKMATRVLEAGEEWAKCRKESLSPDGGVSEREGSVTDPSVPLGFYEPHSGHVIYRSETQPTKSRVEVLSDKPRVLGGSKVGNGAWSIAWVDTVIEYATQDVSQQRQQFVEEAEADPNSVVIEL